MTYFKINNTDFSDCVSKLKVGTEWIYKARDSASGVTIVKPVGIKRTVEVGIRALPANRARQLLTAVNNFTVNISFQNPDTDTLETIPCYVPEHVKDYYTINDEQVLLNPFTISFKETAINT